MLLNSSTSDSSIEPSVRHPGRFHIQEDSDVLRLCIVAVHRG